MLRKESEAKLNNSENFLNRELSWLEFNEGVLQEVKDRKHPLLERIKFLTIAYSNLDEFFMVKVASIKDQVNEGITHTDPSGLVPKQQLRQITIRTKKMVRDIYSMYKRGIVTSLNRKQVKIYNRSNLPKAYKDYLKDFFLTKIYPELTPIAVNSSRPFPLILNKGLNLAVLLEDLDLKKNYFFVTVQLPTHMERLISLPSEDDIKSYILLEDVVMEYIGFLFEDKVVVNVSPYRITRNADLSIQEEEEEDILIKVERTLLKRKWGAPIRIELHRQVDKRTVEILRKALDIHPEDFYYINGPLDLSFLWNIYNLNELSYLRYKEYKPIVDNKISKYNSIWEAITNEDILLHHPYDPFKTVEEFIATAAIDTKVKEIKQTLYRIGSNSFIVDALAKAAEKGKRVTVLVEVTARFDEENNIGWAKQLEKAGCHVLYGIAGLKTHAKMVLVMREEEDGVKRYVHISTGNYNDSTAKQYTDIGLFTSNEAIGRDVADIFRMLSGEAKPPTLAKLSLAPFTLRKEIIALIDREATNAEQGFPARIIAKMNSLSDTEVIKALYRASRAGVKIDLIIRGICCLKPGIPDVSEGITVKSILGRFLEHSRVFYFCNRDKEEVFISSADWMRRNLDRRVEILVPIISRTIKQDIIDMLEYQRSEIVKGRYLNYSGSYDKIKHRGKKEIDSQEFFVNAELASKKGE